MRKRFGVWALMAGILLTGCGPSSASSPAQGVRSDDGGGAVPWRDAGPSPDADASSRPASDASSHPAAGDAGQPPLYSITHPPPDGWYPYAKNPESLLDKPLPPDVMSHLYVSPQGTSGDAIAQCTLIDCGGEDVGVSDPTLGFAEYSSPQSNGLPGANDEGIALYYASDEDPWYQLEPGDCAYSPELAVAFHAPSDAHFSGSSDQNIGIWDQAQQLMIHMYRYGGTPPYRTDGLGACSATSATTACRVQVGQTGCAAQRTDGTDRDWGWTGYEPFGSYTIGSNSNPSVFAALAGVVRGAELQSGILHAVQLNYACSNTENSTVFPNTSNGGSPAALCGADPSYSPQSAERPPNGGLLFLDYSDAQIAAMSVATWQKNLLTALARYGGYLNVTSGTGPLAVVSPDYTESGQAWADAKLGTLGDPLYGWLEGPEHQPCEAPGLADGSQCRFVLAALANVPVLAGPSCTGPCDISHHIHMADPCVAKGLAGMTAADGACF
jgi:hypothetical protein